MENIKNKIVFSFFAISLSISAALPAKAAAYTYTSREYGFSIECPQKPLGVVPLVDSKQKGEILVFSNDGYFILKGWIIATNAFDTNKMPDFDNLDAKETQKYVNNLKENNNYAIVRLIKLHGHKVLYAVTQKDAYVNDDNKKAPLKQSTSQRIETYIPGEKTNYAIVFFKSGDMTKEDIYDYQEGLISFKEIINNKVKDTKKK
ncbi:hypothetical protein [Pectinatus sottacetonis]|uniref:hypothetical protein n=1 Tax=Pectinatus sottacetonis TaxID=1002795 RepID=UPI0018C69199|nr:hypothetical protein [Pectinatus sottacetonis]